MDDMNSFIDRQHRSRKDPDQDRRLACNVNAGSSIRIAASKVSIGKCPGAISLVPKRQLLRLSGSSASTQDVNQAGRKNGDPAGD